MTELLAYRDRFPILEHTTYLINHSLGAMPAAVEERMREYARTWAERGIRAWGEGWWTTPLTVGDQIGRIVGAPPGTVCMHQNVSVAESIVLSCFQEAGERNRIVYERENFPSVRYVFQSRRGLEVAATDDVLGEIDERTLLVPVQHVLFKSGEIQDVEAIVRRAHDAGAYVVLDAYQSAGTVPLDVTELGVDFAVGGSVKWLCGGPGRGLAVRAAGSDRPARAVGDWLAGARSSVRVRARARVRRRDRALPHRHAERSGALRLHARLRPDRGDRRRADPGELAAADAAPHRGRGGEGLRGALAARGRSAAAAR